MTMLLGIALDFLFFILLFSKSEKVVDVGNYGVWIYPNFRGKCKSWKAFVSLRPIPGCHSLNVSNLFKEYDDPWEMVENLKLFRFDRVGDELFMRGYKSADVCVSDESIEKYDTSFRGGHIDKCQTVYKWKRLGITIFRVQNKMKELSGWEAQEMFLEMHSKNPENYVTVQYYTGRNCQGDVLVTETFRINSALLKFFFKSFKDEFCGKRGKDGRYEYTGKCLWDERGVSGRFFCGELPPLDYLTENDGNTILDGGKRERYDEYYKFSGEYDGEYGEILEIYEVFLILIFLAVVFVVDLFLICLIMCVLLLLVRRWKKQGDLDDDDDEEEESLDSTEDSKYTSDEIESYE